MEISCYSCSVKDTCKKLLGDVDPIDIGQKIVKFKKGETIFKQDAFSSGFGIVTKGVIKQYVSGSYEKKIILKLNTPSSVIGYANFISDINFGYNLQALNFVQICFFDINKIKTRLLNDEKFLMQLQIMALKNEQFLIDKIKVVATNQIHGKLAYTLNYLSQKKIKDQNVLELLSRKELSELSGMATESLIRLLKEFKNDGIVEIDKRSIVILNQDLIDHMIKYC